MAIDEGKERIEEIEEEIARFLTQFSELKEDTIQVLIKHIYDFNNPHRVTVNQLPSDDIISRINLGSGVPRIQKELLDNELVTSETVRKVISSEFDEFTQSEVSHEHIQDIATYSHQDIDDHLNDDDIHLNKKVFTVGDGANSIFVLSHNLGNRDLVVSVRNTTTNQFSVPVVDATSIHSITVTILPIPAIGEYVVTVVG